MARRAPRRLRPVPPRERRLRRGRGPPARPPRRPAARAPRPGGPPLAGPRRRGSPGHTRSRRPRCRRPWCGKPDTRTPTQPRLRRARGRGGGGPPRRAARRAARSAGRDAASRDEPAPAGHADHRRHPAGRLGQPQGGRHVRHLQRHGGRGLPGRRDDGLRDAGWQRADRRLARREAQVGPPVEQREPHGGRRPGRRVRGRRGLHGARHNPDPGSVSRTNQAGLPNHRRRRGSRLLLRPTLPSRRDPLLRRRPPRPPRRRPRPAARIPASRRRPSPAARPRSRRPR